VKKNIYVLKMSYNGMASVKTV